MPTEESIKKVVAWMGYEYIDATHVKDAAGAWVVNGRQYDPWTSRAEFNMVWKRLPYSDQLRIVDTFKTRRGAKLADIMQHNLAVVMDEVFKLIDAG